MIRHLFLFLFLATAAGAAEPTVPTVAPHDLAAKVAAGSAPLVLDVRSQQEFDAGHVPGAVLIPHDQLEKRLAELGPPREVVVYCRSGHRAGLVEPLLVAKGFEVSELAGDWQAWQAAGLPEEKPAAAAGASSP